MRTSNLYSSQKKVLDNLGPTMMGIELVGSFLGLSP